MRRRILHGPLDENDESGAMERGVGTYDAYVSVSKDSSLASLGDVDSVTRCCGERCLFNFLSCSLCVVSSHGPWRAGDVALALFFSFL